MPFPLTGRHPVSNKDILSFTLDNPDYDVHRPVCITFMSSFMHLVD
jgi:hypothetical protein